MVRTSVFRSNRTQAVRLPKAVAFPADVHDVDIIAAGSARVVVPAGGAWDYWFSQGARVDDDFLRDRDQPVAQERATL
ncbi:MAG: type II toxin-antitoxin system VapB family antitoxin [Protaetiibacter sp.]